MTRGQRRRGVVTLGLSLTLVVTLTQQAVAGPKRLDPVAPQKDPTVSGRAVEVLPPATGTSQTAKLRPGLKVAWPEAGATEVSFGTGAKAAQAARAGTLPVSLTQEVSAHTPAAPSKIRVGVRDRAAADKAGVHGVLLDVRRTDGSDAAMNGSLSVDYSAFRYAYGGDWAARLKMVSLPACAAVTPEKPECRTATPLRTNNDLATGRLSAPVSANKSEALYALDAPPEGGTGDYKATDLSPAGKWNVSAQTGDFTWTYPLHTPKVPGELGPNLELAYSSGSTDGKVASTNNQPGWLGEGWSLWPGYIERSYKPCAEDDVVPKTADTCWETDNASLSLRGHTTELVKDAEKKVWRPKADDGTRVEQLFGATNDDDNGEHWRVTTTDGVQYYFGLNRAANESTWTMPVYGNDVDEPCHDKSWCMQAWRWNLDYVVDTNDNSISYFYKWQKNKYGRDNGKSTTEYVRGGTLDRVEYGTRRGHESDGNAPAKVTFDVQDRCVEEEGCETHDGAHWPDVPWDQDCAAATCPKNTALTFWSTKRLAGVTTQVWDGQGYKDADKWTFDHSYPTPGDGTSESLWLDAIHHVGLVGTSAEIPSVTFVGEPRRNRVNTVDDGLPKMNKFRMHAINTESGGTIAVTYNDLNCSPEDKPTPADNTTNCYPIRWTPKQAGPVNDWFVKYTVRQVAQIDRVARNPTQITSYDYEGDAAWAYDDDPLRKPEYRTWSKWRGYEQVVVREGDPADTFNPQSATRYHYFRGMNGDRKTESGGTKDVQVKGTDNVSINDDDQLNGQVREEIAYNGLNGPVVTDTFNDPWSKGPTATSGTLKAYMTNVERTVVRTAVPGGWRTTESKTSFDDYGMATKVNDKGDTSRDDDDQCVSTWYARNTDIGLVDRKSRIEKTALPCSVMPKTVDDIITDTRISFDGRDYEAIPSRGNATTVQEIGQFDGVHRDYVVDKTTGYDRYGRVTFTTNALGKKTTTAYSPDTGIARTVTETNPLGHTKTTTYEPARYQPVLVLDPNNKRTELTYDGLGRLTGVWLPGRNKLGGVGPNSRYSYDVRSDHTTTVTTEKLKPNGNYVTSYGLLDGFMRPRQTQDPTPVGGRLLTDMFYDSRGLEAKSNSGYHNVAKPSTDLLVVEDNAVPAQTTKEHDGAERETSSSLVSLGTKKWSTTTKFNGDSVEVHPPAGGTATVTFNDAHGRTTELRQLTSSGPDPAYQATKYTYNKAGDSATIVDTSGNVWTNTYDLRGRKIRATDPDKGVTTNTYDAAARVTSTTDARGKTVANVYDDLDRRIETHENSVTGPLLATWSFDKVAKGKQDKSVRYVGTNAYQSEILEFDPGYRPKRETVTIPAVEGALGRTYTTVRTYYADGSEATTALPDVGDLGAETLSFTYDDLGLPRTTSGQDKYVTQSTYTALSEPTQLRLGGEVEKAVWNTHYYDVATRRMTDNITQRELVGAMEVGRTVYKHDPIGNVKQVKETAPGIADDKQCFTYDALRQLSEAWTATNECEGAPGGTLGGPAPYWTSYKYDTVGNRIEEDNHGGAALSAKASTKKTVAFPTPGQPRPHAPVNTQKGLAAAAVPFEYDDAGNMVKRPGPDGPQTLTWDTEGQMTEVTGGGKRSRYVYDASGTRLIAEEPTGTTLFLSGTEVRLTGGQGAKAASTVTATRYYNHGGTPVAVRTTDGTLRYVTADSRQTTSLTVDADTLAPSQRRFAPFGGARGAAPADWPGQRGYIGGVKDSSTDLTRLGARDYDPSSGTFVTTDAVLDTSNPQTLNPYAYSGNNPTSMSDPSGNTMIDNGVEQAEHAKAIRQADADAAAAGRPKTNRGTSTYQARGAFFGPAPAGAKRAIFNGAPKLAEDQGIIVGRFFIKDKLAAFGTLLGDNRDFTTDVNASSRFIVAWDTWTGQVSITVFGTHTAPYQPATTGRVSLPREESKFDPPRDLSINNQPPKDYLLNNFEILSRPGEGAVGIRFSPMNSNLPCCHADGEMSFKANRSGVQVLIRAERYPDVEVIQYRAEGSRMIGQDVMDPDKKELGAIGRNNGSRFWAWQAHN
jgi:RHS repeat-associated protein